VNAGGAVIVLFGAWVLFQVVGGDALQRLKVVQ
jgi:hypothetical protein